MNKQICIIGASGLAKEIYWLIKDCGEAGNVACFMEPDDLWQEKTLYGLPVKKQSEFDSDLHLAVLAIGDSHIREKVVKQQLPPDTEYPTLIHPSVRMSDWVNIGRGGIICAGNIITCDVSIGEFALVNLDCTIGHDCLIGNYFSCNPGVHLSGNCVLGKHVSLGTGAVIRQGITITDNSIIGMGGVVVKSISESGTYIGNPVKPLSK